MRRAACYVLRVAREMFGEMREKRNTARGGDKLVMEPGIALH